MVDHHIDLGYIPRAWQRTIHLSTKRFILCVCHRRGGKTIAAKMELIHRALTKPRFEGAYIAPFLSQARRVMWLQLRDLAAKIPGVEARETEMMLTFPNGSTIRCLGADSADGIRGLGFDFVVGDEFADWGLEVLPMVVFPTLAGRNGGLMLIGTPKGVDPLSEAYDRNKTNPEWDCFLFSVDQTGVFNQDEIRQMKANMLPAQFDLEFMCKFDSGAPDQLFAGDLVNAACAREIPDALYLPEARIMGVDVARQGADASVIFRRQGLMTWDPEIFHSSDLNIVCDRVQQTARSFEPDAIFVDGGGIGAGVVDMLRALGTHVIEVQFGATATDPIYKNKRAEMYFRLWHWLNGGGKLPYSPDLKNELTVLRYLSKDGYTQIEGKDEIRKRLGRSVDRADALAMTFCFPVAASRDRYGLKQSGCATAKDKAASEFFE